MLKISILKLENPSCIWGRVIQDGDSQTAQQYQQLQARMNLFYSDVTRDLQKLKPKTLEKGQVCVAYCSEKRSWCRATVESVITDSVSSSVRCLLVDHGEQLVVLSDQVRVVLEKFLQLPFWVKRFHLARVHPVTLRVSLSEEKAELVPSAWWDGSATLYVHNLLQASTRTEAVLLHSECESTSMELYLTIGNIKICVNDDLVSKRFAHYGRTSADCEALDEEDPFPLMLSPRAVPPTAATASDQPRAQAQPPPVRSQDQATVGPGNQITAPLTPQHEELDGCGPEEAIAGSSACTGQKFYAAAEIQLAGEPQTEDEEASLCVSRSRRSAESGREVAEERRTQENQACSWLLEWLNPEPLNTNRDAEDDTVAPSDPRQSSILVHSAHPVEPCTSLDDAPITDALRWVLQRKKCTALTPGDGYIWPAVARGCNTLVISRTADQPRTYLAPLLTHILLNSIFDCLDSSTGPVAVLLCPGWEKAQAAYDLLEEYKVARILHPLIVLLGVGKDEAKTVKIPQNCRLLVTTPFTLVRLLSWHHFKLLRLYHLVLDEADQLFALAPDQMESVLQHFQKVENAASPQQIVAVAKRWIGQMECLLANHMPFPYIAITVPEEAALYGNVQQIILMTAESSKTSGLLGALELNPDVGQKTLVVASSAQEVEDVFEAVSSRSAFCLKAHEGLTHQFEFVIQQWSKDVGAGTQVILVTTDDCLRRLGIWDASCVFHHDFPSSPKLFGGRLLCMAANFRNLSEETKSRPRPAKSLLLISERNVRHLVGLMRYLGRTDTLLPPELLTFAQEIRVAREDQKTDKPLCRYLKSFGVCRDSSVCPERHRFMSQLDRSQLPASGVIEVVPLYIKTASVFHGRVVGESERGFDSLVTEMASYYVDKKPGAKEMLEGGLYAVQEGDTFHRVKLLNLPDRPETLFYRVLVRFIDVGHEEEVKSHQVLQLPERFHSLPGQAVEIVVCRVKPVDGEVDWHPKATRAVSQKIRGLQHRARAVLSLGNTVFVDPMVRVTHLPGLKTVINEHNVQSEILNTGMGVSNPEHVNLLRALCQGDEASRVCGSANVEDVLAESFRAAEVRGRLAAPEPVDRSLTQKSPAPIQLDVQSPSPSDLRSGVHVTREERTGSPKRCQHGLPTGEGGSIKTNGSDDGEPATSFHPQLCWYQTSDCVMVTVKLVNPESQCCDFHPDRVVYRGRVNGRAYRADLDLQGSIDTDRCCWEMKSNKPVLKLVKQQPGHWEKLVRNKNIFVSYDMEHLEEDGERASCGRWFVGNTGEDGRYVNVESDSDSD